MPQGSIVLVHLNFDNCLSLKRRKNNSHYLTGSKNLKHLYPYVTILSVYWYYFKNHNNSSPKFQIISQTVKTTSAVCFEADVLRQSKRFLIELDAHFSNINYEGEISLNHREYNTLLHWAVTKTF